MSFELWNILHDGIITQITGEAPGDIQLTVEIGYLRNMFPGDGTSIIVTLKDCTTFEYEVDGKSVDEFNDAQILQALGDAAEAQIDVECRGGVLHLNYADVALALDDGTAITQNDLGEAAFKYWDNLSVFWPWVGCFGIVSAIVAVILGLFYGLFQIAYWVLR